MPKEPADFDCRSAAQVLRLRLRDWMWPLAAAIAVTIPVLGNNGGVPYKIGSVTYYANTYGPSVFLLSIVFAGLRWCWIGHLRPRPKNRCGSCGYPTTGLAGTDSITRCPECGAEASLVAGLARPAGASGVFSGVPLARWLIDLPGLLALLFVGYVVVILILLASGLIDD